MFNTQNGEIGFDDCLLKLGPALTVEEFLASPLAKDAKTLVTNEDWCSWSLPPHFMNSSSFAVSLFFHNGTFRKGRLARLHLASVDPKFGESWCDWTKEREESRKQFHDDWLTCALGQSGGLWPWGRVDSVFDQKSGCSIIIVRYGDIHIVFRESEMLLTKRDYRGWREIQDAYEDYKASLGPYTIDEVIEYLMMDYDWVDSALVSRLRKFASSKEVEIRLR